MNLCPYLIFSEAQSLPSRAQFQEPQGYTLGLFQGREKAGLGSGQGPVKGVGRGHTVVVSESSVSLCYSEGN